jgi:FkbM family methyltransferase
MAIADAFRAIVDESRIVRSVVKSPVGQRVIQAQRAARVASPHARFLVRELTGNGAVARYRLADGLAFNVRHGTRDVGILNEVFGGTSGRRSYQAPAELAARLQREPVRVLDLGGNVGLFALYAFASWNVTDLVSFEPDPGNAEILRETVAGNPRLEWRVEQAAVSNEDGTLAFRAGLFSEARSADAGEDAIRVPMLDVFEHAHGFDLVKIDIEGGEWPILADPRLATADASMLVMEWHERGCPEQDAHWCALRLLDQAGFAIAADDPAPHGGNGLIWAARP